MSVFSDAVGNTFNLDFNLDQDEVYLNDGNDVADLTKSSGVFAYGGNGDDFLKLRGYRQSHSRWRGRRGFSLGQHQ